MLPRQGLNAVAFSGYACAHKIGSKLNINSFKFQIKSLLAMIEKFKTLFL